jgi:hypothetical protein
VQHAEQDVVLLAALAFTASARRTLPCAGIVGIGISRSCTRGSWPSRSPKLAVMKASCPPFDVVNVGIGASSVARAIAAASMRDRARSGRSGPAP